MVAITDKFTKASDGSGAYVSLAAVSSAREIGGDSLICDDLAGWAKDTPIHFTTYRVLSDGSVDAATQTDWKGIVSNNTITKMQHVAGPADSGNMVGDKVEINPTVGWVDDLMTGILKSLNQDGTLKSEAIKTALGGGSLIEVRDTKPESLNQGQFVVVPE